MLPAGLQSAAEVLQHYDQTYFEQIATGQAEPYVYPRALYGVLFIFLYLLIDHRKSSLRIIFNSIAVALFGVFQLWCVRTNRARSPGASYGVGIVGAFSFLWVASHLIVRDCQKEYRCIARRARKTTSSEFSTSVEQKQYNGHPDHKNSRVESSTLYWQSYPESLSERVVWVAQLFASFRGVGWNWESHVVPHAPAWVRAQLEGESQPSADPNEVRVSHVGVRRFTNRRDLVIDSVFKLFLGYLALDVLKTYTLHDPYFWGYTDAPPPAIFPQILQNSYVFTKTSRLLGTMVFTSVTLGSIFKLGPIFFAGILGPRVVGLSGEAWMNPADMFGSFSNVLDNGLAGFWGGFWHQVFRYTFQAPSARLLSALGLDKRSVAGMMLSLAVAFFVSGILHACGSYGQMGDTSPIQGPLTFFMLQGLGITIESVGKDALKSAGVELPSYIKRTMNLGFALIWLYHTGPFLCDDFSQGGVWLFEPVPVSPLRFLGLGPADAEWLCWGRDFASWHNGKSWWESGLSL